MSKKKNKNKRAKKVKARNNAVRKNIKFIPAPSIVLGEVKDVELKQQAISSANGVDCVKRSLDNKQEMGVDTNWGTLLVYDKKLGQFESFFQSHHCWNISKDGLTIYDDINNIKSAIKQYNFNTINVEDFKVKTIDGSKIKCGSSCYGAYWELVDTISPKFKGKCDAIFVSGFAVSAREFNPIQGDKVYTDEVMEDIFKQVA
jgi:hypothetical protein